MKKIKKKIKLKNYINTKITILIHQKKMSELTLLRQTINTFPTSVKQEIFNNVSHSKNLIQQFCEKLSKTSSSSSLLEFEELYFIWTQVLQNFLALRHLRKYKGFSLCFEKHYHLYSDFSECSLSSISPETHQLFLKNLLIII